MVRSRETSSFWSPSRSTSCSTVASPSVAFTLYTPGDASQSRSPSERATRANWSSMRKTSARGLPAVTLRCTSDDGDTDICTSHCLEHGGPFEGVHEDYEQPRFEPQLPF